MRIHLHVAANNYIDASKIALEWYAQYLKDQHSGRIFFSTPFYTGFVKDVKSHLTVNNPKWEIYIRDKDNI